MYTIFYVFSIHMICYLKVFTLCRNIDRVFSSLSYNFRGVGVEGT